MSKKTNVKRIILIILVLLFVIVNKTDAVSVNDFIKIEYTDEYKNWLKLPEEEKNKRTQPRMYAVNKNTSQYNNPLKFSRMLMSSVPNKFSLKDIIKDNVAIRDQKSTGSCWVFAAIGALESNLALNNYYNNIPEKIYDFSERHMEYATSRVFKDEKINEDGFNRQINSGGSYIISDAYLTNGLGAIDEKEMPFENENNPIDISEIQGKKVVTQVYDTIIFPSYNVTDDLTTIKQQMKEHLKNYGGISAGIHGSLDSDCYNGATGAIYCDNKETYPINHDVLIIGWDDDYSKDNFNASKKPNNNGAWIIKNSWGDKTQVSTLEICKNGLFENNQDKYISQGYLTPDSIPDEEAIEFGLSCGFTYEDGIFYMSVGDNGYMYVSYEDVNIYSTLSGIIKASDKVTYENIYQYNKLGQSALWLYNTDAVYFANIFDKKTSGDEFLTQIMLYAPEKYTCKVYVNPKNASKDKNDLKKVELLEGESETFEAGYHTIEFKYPIKITGNQYVVMVEITDEDGQIIVAEEAPVRESIYSTIEVVEGKCFITLDSNLGSDKWTDLSQLNSVTNGALYSGNSTIKAFTVSKDDSFDKIEIATPPTKTKYFKGEDFDKSGMVVIAKYNDGRTETITDYNIIGGTNLDLGTTKVIIEYNNSTVEQLITVENKEEQDNTDKDNTDKDETDKDNTDKDNTDKDDTDKDETDKDEIEVIEPQNSKISNLSANIKDMKIYVYTDNLKQDYMTFSIEVNGISQIETNDNLEYYYYLSGNQKESNIKDWIKISNLKYENGKMKFEINSKDLHNYEQISKSEKLYLYIKEVAIKDKKEKTLITDAVMIEFDKNADIFIDGKKPINSSDIIEQETTTVIGTDNSIQTDKTVANTIIPHAGYKTIILYVIVIVIVIGIVLFIRYKKIDK